MLCVPGLDRGRGREGAGLAVQNREMKVGKAWRRIRQLRRRAVDMWLVP